MPATNLESVFVLSMSGVKEAQGLPTQDFRRGKSPAVGTGGRGSDLWASTAWQRDTRVYVTARLTTGDGINREGLPKRLGQRVLSHGAGALLSPLSGGCEGGAL